MDCSASTGVTPSSINGAVVTFDIDSENDVLDCTYTNRLQQGAIEITKTRKHAASGTGDHTHAGVTFTVTGGTCRPSPRACLPVTSPTAPLRSR